MKELNDDELLQKTKQISQTEKHYTLLLSHSPSLRLCQERERKITDQHSELKFVVKEEVLKMLAKYVPRVSGDGFQFDLIVDGEREVIWKWVICLKIRFTWFRFTINGLVHAKVQNMKITYQREYYDPMESISVIPVVGKLYKLILKMG